MRALNSSLIVVLGVGILTGCGGGGDNGGSNGGNAPPVRQPVAINASNGLRIAQDVVQGSEVITSESGATIFAAPASARHGSLLGLRAVTHDMALESLANIPARGFVSAVGPTQNCPGGGARSIDGSDNNANGQPDAGDSVKVAYQNCSQDGVVKNGTIAVNIVALEGDLFSPSADYSFTFGFRFDDFSVRQQTQGLTLNGGYNLADVYQASTAVDRVTTSGSELNFTDGVVTARLVNFNFFEILDSATQQNTAQYHFSYDSSEFAGSVTVVTNVPFKRVQNLPPESGTLTIRGANNMRVLVQATGGGTARISIDANGDGDFTDSQDRVINGQWTTLFG